MTAMNGEFKIGIISDMLRLPFKESILKCAGLGADGIQLYAVEGEMAPENLTDTDIREQRIMGLPFRRFAATSVGTDLQGRRKTRLKLSVQKGLLTLH